MRVLGGGGGRDWDRGTPPTVAGGRCLALMRARARAKNLHEGARARACLSPFSSSASVLVLIADDDGHDDDREHGRSEEDHDHDHADVPPAHVALEAGGRVLELVRRLGEHDRLLVDVLELVRVLESRLDVALHDRAHAVHLGLHVRELVDRVQVVELVAQGLEQRARLGLQPAHARRQRGFAELLEDGLLQLCERAGYGG